MKESVYTAYEDLPLFLMVRGIHMMLHEALDMAVRLRLIVKNPTVGTTIPKNNYPPKQILNDEQLERFMQRIRQDERWYDFFYTELTTGLRRGEICGLKWEDFDAENGKLKVRRSVAKRKGGGLNIGETKTETGTRTIVLPPSTAELLRKRKETAVSEWISLLIVNDGKLPCFIVLIIFSASSDIISLL